MQTYQITIEPLSPFGTPLKGDTLFGQFCWQASYAPQLLAHPLDQAIGRYGEQPFVIFSSAFPVLTSGGVALKRPDAPLEILFDLSGLSREERVGRRKEHRNLRWLRCDRKGALADLSACSYLTDADLGGASTDELQSRNSINRLTGTTGNGFAPYTSQATYYPPGSRLALFAGIDESVLTADSLRLGLDLIGQSGFGRDASTGLGKFRVTEIQQIDLASFGADNPNALYTLAPSVPEKGVYRDTLYTPFTRFGRHGDRLALSGKPFKNLVIMADEGALLFPLDPAHCCRTFVGSGLSGVSLVQQAAVCQGYSLCIPVRLEVA